MEGPKPPTHIAFRTAMWYFLYQLRGKERAGYRYPAASKGYYRDLATSFEPFQFNLFPEIPKKLGALMHP